jgi:hypothetical protein
MKIAGKSCAELVPAYTASFLNWEEVLCMSGSVLPGLKNGRTSMLPHRASGTSAVIWIASFRSREWIRMNPPRTSFVSANGQLKRREAQNKQGPGISSLLSSGRFNFADMK